jgi:hypothetical protein
VWGEVTTEFHKPCDVSGREFFSFALQSGPSVDTVPKIPVRLAFDLRVTVCQVGIKKKKASKIARPRLWSNQKKDTVLNA